MFRTIFFLSICLSSFAVGTTITPAPELHARQSALNAGSLSCNSYTSLNLACASSTPGFLSLGPGQQYSCLCFSRSTWEPSIYEGYVQGCLSYLKTASTAYYSSIGGDALPTDYCTSVSNLLATATSTSSSASAATSLEAPLASYFAACNSWANLVTSCASETSSFTGLKFSVQASCLCGSSSSSYLYDAVWQSCLSYQQIADPTEWSSLGGTDALSTPCAAAAGQLGSATALLTSSVATATSSPTSCLVSSSAAGSSSLGSSTSSRGARQTSEGIGLYSLVVGIFVSMLCKTF